MMTPLRQGEPNRACRRRRAAHISSVALGCGVRLSAPEAAVVRRPAPKDSMINVRHARPSDEPFLWLMLTYAASMDPPGELAVKAAMADPTLRSYIEGWGRPGDLAVIAVAANDADIGAAWVRLGTGAPEEFKVSDSRVPELAVAVLPAHRSEGVGTALLQELLTLCRHQFPAILLSVREENPAVRFYQRLGFHIHRIDVNRVGGRSLVMRHDLDGNVPDSPSTNGA